MKKSLLLILWGFAVGWPGTQALAETVSLVPAGSVWKYLDTGLDLGTSWIDADFDDTGWLAGPAELGYGDNNEATVVNFGPDSNNKYITTYFRHAFVVPDPGAYVTALLRVKRDDGVVVYLNGLEIFRDNMPVGPISFTTLALSAASDDGSGFLQASLDPGLLVPGDNVLAAEIHQNTGSSSDISFDLELTGNTENSLPSVAIAFPSDNSLFTTPASILITAAASDSDGSISLVEFFQGNSKLGEDAGAPYAFNWPDVPVGEYQLRVVATDNLGGKATSAVVRVFVQVSTSPTVSGVSPAPGPVNSLQTIAVTFSEPVQGVEAGDLLLNGLPARAVSGDGAVYTFTAPPLPEGTTYVAWKGAHGIMDFENPPKAFDPYGVGASWQYELNDTAVPLVVGASPTAGASLRRLSQIVVTFSEAINGLNAADLLINGSPAGGVTGSGAGPYVFEVTNSLSGAVTVAWATGHGITDQAVPPNSFAGGPWSYTVNTNAVFRGQVVINEIMYHPASERIEEEYIELWNRGASAVNLTGWRLERGVDFAFPSVTVPAGGYLVVAADLAAFQSRYPGVVNVVGGWSGRLSNSAEDIELEDASGDRVDLVAYADEGDYAVRRQSPIYPEGWDWYSEADGLGKSLELRNAALSHEGGQNWLASLSNGGTPGTANSVATNNIPPLILNVRHFPAVPRSSDLVTITAAIDDEQTNTVVVRLWWRDASTLSPPAFASTNMLDNGTRNDGAAGDGLYGAVLPALVNRAVVEFYVEAVDSGGRVRTWPGPAEGLGQVVNAQYQVDDEAYAGTQPVYRIIMTEVERNRLAGLNRNSDAQMNPTFVAVEGDDVEIRYNCGIRYRGAGTRGRNPPNYKFNIPSDRKWNDVSSMNLNSQFTHVQVLGSRLALKAGLPAAHVRPVQVRVNGVNSTASGSPQYGSYAHVEVVNGEWAEHHFPEDGAGNVYSKRRPLSDLVYRGTDPQTYISYAYYKESNQSENDWTDLFNLTFALDPATTPDSEYLRAVLRNVNVELWLRYFVVCSLMEYSETALCTGEGDDYDMYRGIVDPRFMVVPHDFDTIFNQGDTGANLNESIYVGTALPTMNRFLRHPQFEPLYHAEYRHQLAAAFSTNQILPLVDQVLGDWVPAQTVSAIKTFIVARNAAVLAQLPAAPVLIQATLSGEPDSPTYSSSATLTVGGEGITHYRFRLNGGALGPETPVATPINLNGLADGTYTVYVVGRNGFGQWQAETAPTISKTWAVLSSLRGVLIHEVLALNNAAVNHEGTFPDLIELFNAGGTTVNLAGMRLTDDLADPNKFVFPPNTTLASGGYLVLYANSPDGTLGLHTGFGLNQDGEILYLLGPTGQGNRVLDSVEFGLQLADRSVGRLPTGQWGLCLPTFGSANSAAPRGNPRGLKINEWLANPAAPFFEDFIELHNPDSLPVAMGGLYLTDQPIGLPFRHEIAPLSFVDGYGYRVFKADGNPGAGADHVSFQLAHEVGEIALLDQAGQPMDHVVYALQRAGVSEGRTPNGGSRIVFFDLPTPGAGNPASKEPLPPLLVNLVPLNNSFLWRYSDTGTDLGTSWREVGYNDSSWPSGPGLLASPRPGGALPEPIRTVLSAADTKSAMYFRARFNYDTNLNTSALQLNHIIDDGAVFYLNGVEVYRVRMSPGTVLYGTLASENVLDATYSGGISIPMAGLRHGENLIAVEAHNSRIGSPDLVMGLTLDAVILTNNPALAGVVLNEAMANNRSSTNTDGTATDWVEIYNPSQAAVDLAGMSLTDDTANAGRWVFPAGSVVPAGGYLVVRFDPDTPPSTNASPALNTGYGLKASGDEVYLFNRPAGGGELLDGIPFGLQAPDWSIGRVPDGGSSWSLTQPTQRARNLAATLGDPRRLKVNEWMANPVPGKPDWFEIHNPNAQPVALGGLYLTDDETKPLDQQHLIAPHSYIAAGLLGFQEFKADDDTSQGGDHVNFKLSGGGELIRISDTSGNVLIDKITFGSQTEGVSEGRLPDGSANVVRFPSTATPGESNFLPIPDVVLNEVLSHSDLPYEDAIEVRNLSPSPVNMGGWYLSDSRVYLEKFRIPDGTTLPAQGYRVFYEYRGVDNQPVDPGFNPRPGDPDSFALSSAGGDEVYLSAAAGGMLTGYRRVVSFGPAANGVSFGRHVTSAVDGRREEFVAMASRTFGVDNPDTVDDFRSGTGLPNSGPKIGPVVITEIMYHPPDLGGTNDNVRDEFIELRNVTAQAVRLYDLNYPTNRWRLRDAVDFEFPPNTTLPAGGVLLVVSFDPVTNATARAGFEATYGLTTPVTLVGPYQGKLDNSSDSVELDKPDPPELLPGPDYGKVPRVLVERVRYFDVLPWPVGADGLGLSLQRINTGAFGNDAGNWSAGTPTPGPQAQPGDTDGDGLPDTWETQYGLNPNNPSDAGQDKDGDGASNLAEYQSGTDPTDPDSVLRLAVGSIAPLVLEFVAEPSRGYTVEFQNVLDRDGIWQVLRTVDPAGTRRVVQVPDPAPGPSRFYRVRTP